MAEFSCFWTTSDTPSGHQVSGYTQAHWSTAAKILATCKGFEGVAPDYLNSLTGSVTGANTVQINTGGAIVDGKIYNNSTAVDVNIPSAVGGGNTRIDRIVLRCDWASFTVAITRIEGTDAGSPTAPAITQTPGTTYDIMLYQALVNTGGTVTITDERVVASDFYHRQGGSASDWSAAGANNYLAPKYLIQSGVIEWTGAAFPSGVITVTFPVAFSNKPILIANSAEQAYNVGVNSSSTTSAILGWATLDGSTATAVTMNWLAIGPA